MKKLSVGLPFRGQGKVQTKSWLLLLALGLLASLMGWVWQDLNQSLMSLINTAVSVVLHPVGDAVIQLG